jgi:hypothetical protein
MVEQLMRTGFACLEEYQIAAADHRQRRGRSR